MSRSKPIRENRVSGSTRRLLDRVSGRIERRGLALSQGKRPPEVDRIKRKGGYHHE